MDFSKYLGRKLNKGYEDYKSEDVFCSIKLGDSEDDCISFYIGEREVKGYDEPVRFDIAIFLDDEEHIDWIFMEAYDENDELIEDAAYLWSQNDKNNVVQLLDAITDPHTVISLSSICQKITAIGEGLIYGDIKFNHDEHTGVIKPEDLMEMLDSIIYEIKFTIAAGKETELETLKNSLYNLKEFKESFNVKELNDPIENLDIYIKKRESEV